MNEREIAEIRRRFHPEKSNIKHVRGCYVNSEREIISQFDQSLAITPQDEAEKILTVLKKTLSGTLERNLLDITFSTQQVVDSEEHRLLMALRGSELKDEEAVQALYQRIIVSLSLEGNYMILLTHDAYDIPYRSKDGDNLEDASSEVFSYILCSICPVKMTLPALSYYAEDNMLHNRASDYVLSPPELGFMFPSFDDRSTNIYNALYYTKSASENHKDFIDAIFRCEAPMPATEQKESFQSILQDTLAEDCNLDVVQAVQGQLHEIIEDHKMNKKKEPLSISKNTVKGVLSSCEVPEQRITAFEERFDAVFGEDADISPKNIVDSKLEVRMPDVTIQVKPERGDLVETRVIDGTKYILIRADENVEVNGVSIHIARE